MATTAARYADWWGSAVAWAADPHPSTIVPGQADMYSQAYNRISIN